MSPKLVLAISTLALGTAFAAVPAIAQSDSGTQKTGSAESAANPSPAQSYHYPIGRPMNDGGFRAQQNQSNSAQSAERTRAPAIRSAQAESAPGYEGYSEGRRYYDYAGPNSAEPMEAPMESSAAAACAARFRSFDPETGTYMGFDGVPHPCP